MKKIAIIYLLLLTAGILYSHFTAEKPTSLPINQKRIIIDAGHGGYDPGKVAGDTKEKDINLEIATLLAGYLQQGGAEVSLTRKGDKALSDNKNEDLRLRADYTKGETDIFISIHQNSYPSEGVHGAQVFYKKDNEEGKALAIAIQKRLGTVADKGNTRMAKGDGSYYVLKNSKAPSVIVECGFLSNNRERELLLTEDYQKKIAWAVYMGVMDYMGEV